MEFDGILDCIILGVPCTIQLPTRRRPIGTGFLLLQSLAKAIDWRALFFLWPLPLHPGQRIESTPETRPGAVKAVDDLNVDPEAREARVAVLEGGRALERGVSLASGARVEAALEHLGHEVDGDRRRRRPRHTAPNGAAGGRVHRAARPRRRGRHLQELLEVLEIPYTGSPVHACMRCYDKVLTKHALRDAGLPTPDWVSLGEIAFSELGAAEALCRRRAAPRVPARGQAGVAGLVARRRVRAHAGRGAGGADRGVLLRPQGAARARASRAASWPCRSLPAKRCPARAQALPIVEAVARGRGAMTSPRATRSAARSSSARPSWSAGMSERVQRDRAGGLGRCSAAAASRAST